MTDELVKRLREQDEYNKRHYERDPLHEEAADRIEQLTAERDAVQALYDAGTKYWNPVYEKVLHRAEAAEAERDRLRAVLSDIKTASVCSVSRHVAASALGEAAA